ncbi:MAG: hypothetical protein SV775_16605 [Thermodesulfobacteriota bacterium]|nr:hypothetical protein [Thermodesulfobacteriota bacterium]
MANMTKEVMDMFNNPNASKVLATVDAFGTAHVVPHGSLLAIAPNRISFAKLVKGKTWENMEQRKSVSLTAFLPGKPGKSVGYQVKGICEKIETSGELMDKYMQQMPPGLKLAGAGAIRVEEVYDATPGPNCGKQLS